MKNQRKNDELEAIEALLKLSNKNSKSKNKPHNKKNKKLEITNSPNEIKQSEIENDESAKTTTTITNNNTMKSTAILTTTKKTRTLTTTEAKIIEQQKNIIPQQNQNQTHPHNLRPRRKRHITETQEILVNDGNNQFINVKSFKDLQRPSKRSKKSQSQDSSTTVKIEPQTPPKENLRPETNTDNEKKLLSRVEILEKELEETKNLYDEMNRQLKTHTEAIQGLMQVVSSPQNLTNFQHQYAYQQLPNAAQHNQPVQYMPIYAYPQMYYSPMPMNQQQTAAAVVMNQATAATVVAPQQMQQIVAASTTSPVVESAIPAGNLNTESMGAPTTTTVQMATFPVINNNNGANTSPSSQSAVLTSLQQQAVAAHQQQLQQPQQPPAPQDVVMQPPPEN